MHKKPSDLSSRRRAGKSSSLQIERERLVLGRMIKHICAPAVCGTNRILQQTLSYQKAGRLSMNYFMFTEEVLILTAGPIVVVTLTDFIYVPFAAAGLAF